MTTKLDDISVAIGEMRSDLAGLRRDFQAMELRAVESNKRADEHRATIHHRVDDLVDEVGGLKSEISVVKVDVLDSKAVTDEVKAWKQRGIGALAMAGMAGTFVGGVVSAFIAYWWEAIMRMLRAA